MRKNTGKRITIIQGHPDPNEAHLCHALAWAYDEGARAAGHEVRSIDVSQLNFPLIRNQREFMRGEIPPDIRKAQADILWANHLLICYPLWLGTLPALLKGFFEQTFRYGFAIENSLKPKKLLKGRSARIVVTMGMPAAVYRYYFRAHGLKSLESGILSLSGIGPIRASLIGMVEQSKPDYRARWIDAIRKLGSGAK
jgi:putative NADPH-quinone reductase